MFDLIIYSCLGNFCVDDAILKEEGIKEFSRYLANPDGKESDLMPDFFLDDFTEEAQSEIGKLKVYFILNQAFGSVKL